MRIRLNGQPHEAPDNSTLADLLRDLGLADRPAAAEVNRTLVPKAEHASRRLTEGDEVELVTLVGGG
ncbi:MAG: sulfur carrier protein ThiS [Phycisphaeraceae bacterium]|nr:sulfur carrier protein ThiS [Phycisphaeraceae bacterium]